MASRQIYTTAVEEENLKSALYSHLVEVDAIPSTAHLSASMDVFRTFPRIHFAAVVADTGEPVGAIRARVVRDLLFSPFGHALLSNPGCPWTLAQMVEPWPTAEVDAPVEQLITIHSQAREAEGLILTQGGRYAGLLPSAALLAFAAERQERRASSLQQAIGVFRADALAISAALGEATGEMQMTADGVADRATRNGKQAGMVAIASKQSANAIAELAVASEQLAHSGKQIEQRAAETAASIDGIVGHVTLGAEKARTLSAAAEQVDGLVAMISGIADQVGMLAINARIEAARAGPAGASFAVVASQVKSLAISTSEVARKVEAQIREIRGAVSASAEANFAVETIVQGVVEAAHEIRTWSLEQSAASKQIAESVSECARASDSISSNIGDFSERAREAGTMAARLDFVAKSLGQRASALKDAVETFLAQVEPDALPQRAAA